MTSSFKLHAKYTPSGDQPVAIEQLTAGVMAGIEHQTMLGATGTGKTFTMANIIANTGKPALVLAHNKTLAAQLFSEFKEFFPENSVQYFVSYYDYYQPESYVPRRDLYIEKEVEINEIIERYRSAATQALLTRPDVIIVASVSCIYGLGNPDDYQALSRKITVGETYERNKLIRHLIDMQYERSDLEFYTGMFRVRGDVIDVNTAADEEAIRIEFFGDDVEKITVINPISGEVLANPETTTIFPAKQYVTPYEQLKTAFPIIREDLEKEIAAFKKAGRDVEAMRLKQRVEFDLEMLQETGYAKGIENYSRYIERRPIGSPPSTLLDYFPHDWLMFIDESHMTVPQVQGMYNGDQARKRNLVDYGFRLRAALDNRPLKFDEFSERAKQIVYVSATPSDYELNISRQATSKKENATLPAGYQGVAEQIIRPTGLLDPQIEIRPVNAEELPNLQHELERCNYADMPVYTAKGWEQSQVTNLIDEILTTVSTKHRVLVTTLTKKMAEELANFLIEKEIKTRYIHSDIDAIERVEILRELRQGKYDVLVGINLLREGLDLPEVSLVAILDGDKEGFLRSDTSLIQTIGRAARHVEGKVIIYADRVTGSMQRAIDETRRRRTIQAEYNTKHGITPQSIVKAISAEFMREATTDDDQKEREVELTKRAESFKIMSKKEKSTFLKELKMQMEMYADLMEYEKAAEVRDLLTELTSS